MPAHVLVIGYGNPGRLDDGLGPAFAAAVEVLGLPHVTVDSDYQLTVEDAAAVAEHDLTLLVDASVTSAEPFELREVEPVEEIRFTSHTLSPESLLSMTTALFDPSAKALVLAIRGYEFDAFGEKLSAGARANLQSALDFILPHLKAGTLETIKTTHHPIEHVPNGGDVRGSQRPW